jgi:hypothetical protein
VEKRRTWEEEGEGPEERVRRGEVSEVTQEEKIIIWLIILIQRLYVGHI